jgi:hypothetical protein
MYQKHQPTCTKKSQILAMRLSNIFTFGICIGVVICGDEKRRLRDSDVSLFHNYLPVSSQPDNVKQMTVSSADCEPDRQRFFVFAAKVWPDGPRCSVRHP